MERKLISIILKGFFILMIILAGILAEAKTLRIAVLDTGINIYLQNRLKICADGLKDYTDEGILDTHGHGSHVAATIAGFAGKSDYCLVIMKVYSESKPEQNIMNFNLAYDYLLSNPVDVINVSGGGAMFNMHENLQILSLIRRGVVFFAAAGNNRSNLSIACNYFPACYDDKIVIVGNVKENGQISDSSNFDFSVYPIVDTWEPGRITAKIGEDEYLTMNGTSQSCAVATGKYIKLTVGQNEETKNQKTWRYYAGHGTPALGNGR